MTAAPSASCYSFACSADGNRWIVGGQKEVSLSKDLGASWDFNTNFVLELVASSADGKTLMGFGNMRALSLSGDAGVTWTTPANGRLPPGFSLALAASADGINLVRTMVPFLTGHEPTVCMIECSTNSGVTWNRTGAHALAYISIASSADGRKLVAQCLCTGTNSPIYTSTDSGATWVGNIVPGGEKWLSPLGAVASSADGSGLVAVANQHGIYTWRTTPSPTLSGIVSSERMVLSWLVPSTPFDLQQTSSLDNPDWTEVGLQTSLNFNNLNCEVSIPRSSHPVFYRLVLHVSSSK